MLVSPVVHDTAFSLVLDVQQSVLTQQPGFFEEATRQCQFWTKLVNVAGTAPSCGLRGFIRTHFGGSWLFRRSDPSGKKVEVEELLSQTSRARLLRWIGLPSRAARFTDERCRCSRLCGSRVNWFERCRRGSVLVRGRPVEAAHPPCKCRQAHSVRLFSS